MGKRLKRLRDEAGLSQEQLAVAANVPIGTLRNYEQDRRLPRIDAAVRLAKALSISLDTLAACIKQDVADPKTTGE